MSVGPGGVISVVARDDVEVAVDEPPAQTFLRSHQHERFIGRHTKEPRREGRVTAKRFELAEHLHQRGLEEIAAIIVGERVAQKLALDVR